MSAESTNHNGETTDIPTSTLTPSFVLVASCGTPDSCWLRKPSRTSAGYAEPYSWSRDDVAPFALVQRPRSPHCGGESGAHRNDGASSSLTILVGASALAELCRKHSSYGLFVDEHLVDDLGGDRVAEVAPAADEREVLLLGQGA
jgi:hypothetical protein